MSDTNGTTDGDITVTRNAQANRYEAHLGGTLAGVVEYTEQDGKILLTHTEVVDEFRGTKTASTLAAQSVADSAERGLTIVPVCPYIARHIERNGAPGATIEAAQ